MQIAATNPTYIGTEEDIPDDLPPDEVPLLKQPFIRDPGQSIQGLIHEAIGKLGENIVVRRFVRYELGEGLEKKADNFAEEVAKQAGLA